MPATSLTRVLPKVVTPEAEELLSFLGDPDANELLRQDEKELMQEIRTKVRSFIKGEATALELRPLNPIASTIARQQQSRSNIAVLRFAVVTRYGAREKGKTFLGPYPKVNPKR